MFHQIITLRKYFTIFTALWDIIVITRVESIIAKDSETLKRVVAYQAMYGDKLIWVRDYEMFFGMVIVDGIDKRRFEEIEISEEDLIIYGQTRK